jgi:thioredoxin 1
MSMTHEYLNPGPSREEVDAIGGPLVVEFGTGWCEFCRGAQPIIAEAFADFPAFSHIKVEDGRGRPLGRSFHVKLWPTLVVLRDGREVARVVRPTSPGEIRDAFTAAATESLTG